MSPHSGYKPWDLLSRNRRFHRIGYAITDYWSKEMSAILARGMVVIANRGYCQKRLSSAGLLSCDKTLAVDDREHDRPVKGGV